MAVVSGRNSVDCGAGGVCGGRAAISVLDVAIPSRFNLVFLLVISLSLFVSADENMQPISVDANASNRRPKFKIDRSPAKLDTIIRRRFFGVSQTDVGLYSLPTVFQVFLCFVTIVKVLKD